jgi:hypothetical protein
MVHSADAVTGVARGLKPGAVAGPDAAGPARATGWKSLDTKAIPPDKPGFRTGPALPGGM